MEKKTKAVQLKEFREAVVNWENNLYRNGRSFENYMQQIPLLQAITKQYEMCWRKDVELQSYACCIEHMAQSLAAHKFSMNDIERYVIELQALLKKKIDEPRIKMLNHVTKKVTEDPELLKAVDKFIKKYDSKK